MTHDDALLIRLVDDDAVLRHSLAFLLQAEGWTVAEYESAEAFLANDRLAQPGCLVLDIRMDGMSGLELQQELMRRGSRLPVIFLTGHGTMETAVEAMKVGAVDFVAKPIDPERFVEAIRAALAKNALKALGIRTAGDAVAAYATLTDREKEVCRTLAKGLLNREAAIRLSISERTVEGHRAAAFKKLGIRTVADLVLFFAELRKTLPDA